MRLKADGLSFLCLFDVRLYAGNGWQVPEQGRLGLRDGSFGLAFRVWDSRKRNAWWSVLVGE